MDFQSAAVIGLGLMGGSVARELSVRGIRVLGYDTDPVTRVAALRDGVVDQMLPASLEGIEEAELIVLAVPIRAVIDILGRLPDCPRTRLVTDLASTKWSILSEVVTSRVGDRFVGAHPMAGDHRSGWSASRLGLFRGARVYLCPADASTAYQLAEAFWSELGGVVERISEDHHDLRMSAASHVPQLCASALARMMASFGVTRGDLGPGGRDMTRLASSDGAIWTEILVDNSDCVAEALDRMVRELKEIRGLIERGDEQGIRSWLQGAAEWSAGCSETGENPVESVAAASHAG